MLHRILIDILNFLSNESHYICFEILITYIFCVCLSFEFRLKMHSGVWMVMFKSMLADLDHFHNLHNIILSIDFLLQNLVDGPRDEEVCFQQKC